MSWSDIDALLWATAPRNAPRPSRFPEVDIVGGSADTPVGTLTLAATDRGLLACSYEGWEAVAERVATVMAPRLRRDERQLDPVRRELDAYFTGRLHIFSTRPDLRLAGSFGQAVLRALEQVPYGSTVTYAHLAERIGRPRAPRAVGNALTNNPVCVVVPCHRVVPDDDGAGIGGYAGGTDIKRLLLDLEAGRGGPGSDPASRS